MEGPWGRSGRRRLAKTNECTVGMNNDHCPKLLRRQLTGNRSSGSCPQGDCYQVGREALSYMQFQMFLCVPAHLISSDRGLFSQCQCQKELCCKLGEVCDGYGGNWKCDEFGTSLDSYLLPLVCLAFLFVIAGAIGWKVRAPVSRWHRITGLVYLLLGRPGTPRTRNCSGGKPRSTLTTRRGTTQMMTTPLPANT